MKKKKRILISEVARQVFLRRRVTPFKRWMEKYKKNSFIVARATGLSASGVRKACRYEDMTKRTCMLIANACGIPPEVMMFPERYENAHAAERAFNAIREFLSDIEIPG
ncbi:MAG: hypothetical protein DWB56_06885 [Candidatus Jettenia sp.]|uniref:HTH cro/C1-type domain-containing protein n=1 Tax=Candidatus Jettenia caeni TaxID=247490 RepID=I3IMX4_9BACT|nr:hypothetical protein [Candidatus Jettenia sp. AMX1]MBC6928679.1 hypothetical protein [Candidatus Jettenia sp.]NUN23430.1 hypothetical protein [Candidatus Jettenia caeni]KAA0250657.1 MAG: hypothetical protein EDM77_03825 [Candidatus Jettenia sp. AMX1]MCE7879991.1 hypothetical protein [Candidatus Jettenia sp. AMX1]MCQ3926773.1 hypothetical protein [Candidatus Jettenia sp.]